MPKEENSDNSGEVSDSQASSDAKSDDSSRDAKADGRSRDSSERVGSAVSQTDIAAERRESPSPSVVECRGQQNRSP